MPSAQNPPWSGSFTGQNTIKTTVANDAYGGLLWCGATRPGRMHDLTAVRTEGIDALIDACPDVQVLVDTGYQGLTREHPDHVAAPPLTPHGDAALARHREWKDERTEQSSQRIPVEHAISKAKWWHVLQRFTGRREPLPETITAIAGLVPTVKSPGRDPSQTSINLRIGSLADASSAARSGLEVGLPSRSGAGEALRIESGRLVRGGYGTKRCRERGAEHGSHV